MPSRPGYRHGSSIEGIWDREIVARSTVLVDFFPRLSEALLALFDTVPVLALASPSLQPKTRAEFFLGLIAHTHRLPHETFGVAFLERHH